MVISISIYFIVFELHTDAVEVWRYAEFILSGHVTYEFCITFLLAKLGPSRRLTGIKIL